jgi:ABC-2 type transport system permease protein
VIASFAYRLLFNLLAFWLLDYRGAGVLAMAASTFFSGQVVPIALFPEWLELLAWALPFAAMVQAPIEVWLGHAEGLELAGLLGLQAFWGAALLLLGRVVLRAGMRKLVIQGG